MSATTRLTLGVAAVVLLVGGLVFGLMPKQIHIADCGSLFAPVDTAGMTTEAVDECGYSFDKRYPLLFGLFIGGAVLGMAAAFGGRSS